MKPSVSNITVLMVLLALPQHLAFAPTLSTRSGGSIRSMTASTRHKRSSPSFVFPKLEMGFDEESLVAEDENTNYRNVENKKRSFQPESVLFKHMKPVALAAAIALSTFAVSSMPAMAAMSGGRMGGSFSAPSRSMAPSRSSYSGGGGGYSRSYSGGYGRSSTTIIAPSMPFIVPYSPFYTPPVIYGGGVGVMPISRGFNPFSLLLFGGFGFLIVSSLLNRPMETGWSEAETMSVGGALGTGTSVLSLSVAVDVPNRDDPNSLLSVLTRMSKTANTGDRKGVQNLTSQVALEVLRRKSSIQFASSEYEHFRDTGKAQRQFNKWSVEQRSKFEQENANVFGGVDRSFRGSVRQNKGDDNATMAVITLVISIQGDSTKIPKISDIKSVEDALRKIASDSKVDDCLISAEILWTPEDRSETLTRKDVIADYPELIDV